MTFEKIYADNLWNGVESRSGPGSGMIATQHIREDIVSLVARYGILSVLDVGCGDGFWMPDLPGYVGYDPTRRAVDLARRNHPDRQYSRVWPERMFDLVILRDAVQHLPLEAGRELVIRSGLHGHWLLASTFTDGENVDIAEGDAYRPNLQAPPFYLPQPRELIYDGYSYHDPDLKRDLGQYLGLWETEL